MKNLKFILKCILALLPILAVIIYTALVPYGYMDPEYPAWKYTKEISHSSNDSSASTTLILGDSRAMADLVPEYMSSDSSVVNLAVGGATSIEMYYTLNNYIETNGAPKSAIVMFAPFHYTIIDNFWTRTVYFNYLSVPEMLDLYSYAKATGSETLLANGYKNDLLHYRFRYPDKYLPALMNSKLIGRYNDNITTYEKIVSNLGYGEFGTEDGCDYLNYESKYDRMHDTCDALLLDVYMNKLLKLCSENGIDTQFAIPPMNEASYNALNPSYVEEITSYINELSYKYPNISFDATIPCYDNAYFGDSSHLNRKGAEKFTKEFVEMH